MPKGSYFPYDFGFIPSTSGDDGDPLDVLVFMDDPAPVGCVLTIRLIGCHRSQATGEGMAIGSAMTAFSQWQLTHIHMRTLRT